MKIKKQLYQSAKAFVDSLLPQGEPKPLTIRAYQQLSERYRLSDYLTYRYADEKDAGIWLADNPQGMDSYLMGFELAPLIVAGDKAWERLTAILSRLSTGSTVYSIVHASQDIGHYLEQWAMSRTRADNKLFDAITQRRSQYFLDWCRGGIQPIREVSFRPRAMRYYWFVQLPARYPDFKSSSVQAFRHEIQHVGHWVMSELQASGLGVRRLSSVEMTRCLMRFCQPQQLPEDIDEMQVHMDLPLSAQLMHPEMQVSLTDRGDLCFENPAKNRRCFHRVLSATQFPTTPFYLSQMAECIGSVRQSSDCIPSDFYVYSILSIQSPDQVKFRASKKMAMLQYQTASQKEFWQQMMRHLYQRKQHVQALFDAIDKRGQVPVKAWTGVVLSAPSEADLEKATSVCQSIWKGAGFELYQETSISLPAWISTLPGQYHVQRDGVESGLQRGTTLQARHASLLTHVQGDWQGSNPGAGGLLVMSRRGALTTLNLFDTFKSNYNAVIAASSGAGKSFLVNELASDFLARGGMVRIVDAGRSYYNTAMMLGGQNLVFERDKKLCINPFSSIITAEDLKEDMDTLVVLMAQMAFPFGFGAGVDDHGRPYEYRAIEEAIEAIWQDKQSAMSVRDIADYFADASEPDLKRIAKQLRPWAYGRYAEWMVGEANIHFDNPLLVLELDELSDEPELQSIVLNLIVARIAREMYLSTQDEIKTYGHRLPKLIVIDEAWDLLGRPNTGAFIEKAYRRARKYLCSVVIITQSFTDCDKTSAAKAALENANWLITLMHDIASLKKAVESRLLNLSEYSQQMIRTLQKTDDYSELYVINKSLRGEGLYRLVVDPETYWIYTTEGSERARVDGLMGEGLSLEEAVKCLLD